MSKKLMRCKPRKKDGSSFEEEVEKVKKNPTKKSCKGLVGKTVSQLYPGLPMNKEGLKFAKYNVAQDYPECAKYLKKKEKSCGKKLCHVLNRIKF